MSNVEIKLTNGDIKHTFDLIFIATSSDNMIDECSLRNFICERLFVSENIQGLWHLSVGIKAPIVVYDYFDFPNPDESYPSTKVKGIYLGSIYILHKDKWKSFFLHYSDAHKSVIISEHLEDTSNKFKTKRFLDVNVLKLPAPIYVLLTNTMKGIKYIDISSDM